MSRRTARAAALAGALAVLAASAPTLAVPASADANPAVNVATLAHPTLDDGLINLLTGRGINYEPVTDTDSALNADGLDTTLVVDQDQNLTQGDLDNLTQGTFGLIVLLNQDPDVLNAFLPDADITVGQNVVADEISPACNQPNDDAISAGVIESPGPVSTFTYPDPSLGQNCYPVGGAASMVDIFSSADTTLGGTEVVLLGSTSFLENKYLADDGNADLAMRIFGAEKNLVWLAGTFVTDPALQCSNTQCLNANGAGGSGGGGGGSDNGGGGANGGNGTTTTVSPGPNSPTASQPTLESLLPSWLWWVLLQVVLAVVLLAYWRARRLGRIVTEPLPVTVRAAETVEGHARLYRRAGAYGHSARLLRQSCAGRLAPIFGLPQARAEADPRLLVAPIAARLGTDPVRVGDLLAGQDPTSETELVLLADHLDQLEQEVRSS